jgi:malonyl CoA-acyl carrier protein transacylase
VSKLLILFPGQGSQAAGMAEYLWDYPVARATFAEAGQILRWDIGELCRHGSMEELTRTDRTQVALLTCSVAVWRVLEEGGASFTVAAGHSLGEYSALVATGQLAFPDALRVVEQRGRAMQTCAEERGGKARSSKRCAPPSPTCGWPTTTRLASWSSPARWSRCGLPASWRWSRVQSEWCRCLWRGRSTPRSCPAQLSPSRGR